MHDDSKVTIGESDRIRNLKYDSMVKCFFSRREIIAILLQGCVPEYKDCTVEFIRDVCLNDADIDLGMPVFDDVPERILGGKTEDVSVNEGTVQFDVVAYARHPKNINERIGLVIDLEIQNDSSPGYPLMHRALYYACRLISSQRGMLFQHSEYGKLRKVYSLWICPDAPQSQANTVSFFELTEKVIAGNGSRSYMPREGYDLLSVVLLRLNDNVLASRDVAVPVLRFLQALLSNKMREEQRREILEDEFLLTRETGKGVGMVYGYGDSVFMKGVREGREEGKTQQREKDVWSVITQLRANKFSDETMLPFLMNGFSMTEVEAKEYINGGRSGK